ncbi:unnamed protein product [Caenorhabditis auriculariae]|uniref:Uncharacterized protein n=1 Tax=Caenorhabditis auriculariae TaxID=2777116 RepID=A0A8S1GVA9_9PELO|nr:unnamed protein product [Caenorhabditis auriculariae]
MSRAGHASQTKVDARYGFIKIAHKLLARKVFSKKDFDVCGGVDSHLPATGSDPLTLRRNRRLRNAVSLCTGLPQL